MNALTEARIICAQNYLAGLRKTRHDCIVAGVATRKDMAGLEESIKKAEQDLERLMTSK